jgi:carboxylesterase type B
LAKLQTLPDLRIVRTEGGLLSGAGEGVRVYKGIPFAAPPVGPRRWRPPEPAEPWYGIREATSFGADCPQELRPGSRAGGIDEDCLTLNIWTPAHAPDEALPVMVWFYGGSFLFGSASDIRFDGEAFARRDVVLVTAAYRVGLFGYLAHPGLTRIAARRLGQLRSPRPDRSTRLGAAEHCGVRR